MVRQQESEWGCHDQRKDTAHKHNSTKLMAAKQKTEGGCNHSSESLSHVIRKYMLIYAEGDHATDHGEAHGKAHGKGRAKWNYATSNLCGQ